MTTNPYAPPKAQLEQMQNPEVAPPLWNPSAAIYWSLLFSPIFGAFLHMKNWQALGDAEKAAASKRWIIGILVVMLLLVCSSLVIPESKALDSIGRASGIALVLAWRASLGKSQQTFVKERFGNAYERRGWLVPIVLAILAFVGFVFAAGAIAIAFGVA